MNITAIDAAGRIKTAYEAAADPSFADVLGTASAGNDNDLADLVELDARRRLESGLPVTMTRYLRAVPGLSGKRIALDAAIEFSIRWAVGEGLSEGQASERLCAEHPELRQAVTVAMALNEGVCSTTSLRKTLLEPETLALPRDLGPVLPGGGRTRYELRHLLGAGAQGQVYSALDRAMSEPDRPAWVAIKVLRTGTDDPRWRELFLEEGPKARRIEHPNVVRVLDRGVDPMLGDYLAYEQVDGGSLASHMAGRREPMEPREAAQMAVKVCRGVHAVHLAGLLHCDLKPSNVLLTRAGEPKVGDFGTAARLRQVAGSRTPERVGNLAFMAPEQAQSSDRVLAVTVDVYALGGLLFYLLTNTIPADGEAGRSGVRRRFGAADGPSARALNPRVDFDLDAICRRALAHNPADRYGSADAMADDLEAWLGYKALDWTHPGPVRRARLLCRRQPAAVGAAVLGLVLALTASGAGVYAVMAGRERLLRERTEAAERLGLEQRSRATNMESAIASMQNVLFDRERLLVTDEWLPALTIMESVAGPVLFDIRSTNKAIWSTRIGVAERSVAEARERGQAGSLESLFWNDAIAFWSLRAGDADKAQGALDAGDEGLGRSLGPEDPWRTVRETMRACVAVQRAEREGAAGRASDSANLEAQLANLERLLGQINKRQAGESLRLLILQHELKLLGPSLLKDPVRAAKVQEDMTNRGVPPPKPPETKPK